MFSPDLAFAEFVGLFLATLAIGVAAGVLYTALYFRFRGLLLQRREELAQILAALHEDRKGTVKETLKLITEAVADMEREEVALLTREHPPTPRPRRKRKQTLEGTPSQD